MNKNYTTILTPNFDYENIAGAVNPNQMAFKLNNEDRLCEFVEGIKQEFSVKGLPTMEFVELVSQTAKNVSDFAYDEKIQTEKLNWKIESCRNREGKLAVALRIINPTNDKINVDSVVFNFKDADQNVLRVEEPVDLSLRKNENIIFSFDLDYGDSNYNIYNHPVNQNVQLRTYIDAW
ncbi:hypothetical protein [Peribacillus sp. TH27]|uniref:hypothetical protein n=1 Tax=Peribacillus sp. TH27 TaxID=2798484 RepID=UPI0019144EB4|nr:hypothetical protein [Peribacillus sp. TH27]MBK5460711.1 hypothetical protein [Peribacillus sp. TH27]